MNDVIPSSFSTDNPIRSSKEDVLNRKGFSCALAERIKAWDGKESLVIGLTGEWGCGKSSLKNLILEKLRETRPGAPQEAPSIMEFCPWELSQHGSLTSSFFSELAVHLGKTDGKEGKNAAKRMQGYSKALGFSGAVLKSVGGALTLAGVPVGVAMYAGGHVIEGASGMAKKGASIHSSKNKSLIEFKGELVKTMRELKRPVLAVIDDVDRLTSSEICEVFQIVKANGNLPNMVYLLLFDRTIVSEAIDEITSNHGDQFLEKIIQVNLCVPHPPVEAVHQYVFKRLDQYLENKHWKNEWDSQRWYNIWNRGLSSYFNTLRDASRYISAFDFHASLLHNQGIPEVNLQDLIVLETFRLFEPELFAALPDYRTILVGDYLGSFLGTTDKNKQRDAVIEALKGRIDSDKKENAVYLLNILFPYLHGITAQGYGSPIQNHKVCAKQYFDRYFQLSLRKTDVSEFEVRQLRDNMRNPTVFYEQCFGLKKDGRLIRAFELLEAYKDQISKDDLPAAMLSLIKVADLDDQINGRMLFEPEYLDVLAYRQIYFSVIKIESEPERFELLKSAMQTGDGILLIAHLAVNEQREEERQDRNYVVSKEHSMEMISIAVSRIKEFAGNGRLKSLPKATYVLWRWNAFESAEAVHKWINTQLITQADALWVLKCYLNTSISGAGTTYTRFINLETLRMFASTDKISELTASLSFEQLDKDDMRALRAFRQALQWEKEGHPPAYTGPDSIVGDNPLREEE